MNSHKGSFLTDELDKDFLLAGVIECVSSEVALRHEQLTTNSESKHAHAS